MLRSRAYYTGAGTRPGSVQTDTCILHGIAVHMRVRGILAALAIADNMEGFIREAAPGWRVHRLSGERRNEWSVSVSANWRITFEERDGAIEHLNLEDFH